MQVMFSPKQKASADGFAEAFRTERSPKRQRVGAGTEEETMASKERQLAFTRNVMTTLADVASNPALSDKEKEALRASLVAMLSRE